MKSRSTAFPTRGRQSSWLPIFFRRHAGAEAYRVSRLGIRGAAFMVYLYLDHVHKGDEIALIVSYDGKNPEGEIFFGSAIGSARTEPLIAIETPALRKTTITVTPTNTDRYSLRTMEMQGDAHNWHVHDIRIGGVTQLSQAGSLPGDLFASAAIESYVSIAPA